MFSLNGGVLVFLGDADIFWWGRACELRFPCFGGERKLACWSPLSHGVLSFGLKWGAIPSGRENEISLCLAGGERERPFLALIKCEMGSPHALLWRVISPNSALQGEVGAPVSPAPAEDWGAGFAHPSLVGQRKRLLESGFGNGRRVSAGRKASLGGSGGWEGKRTRWTDGCPAAARPGSRCGPSPRLGFLPGLPCQAPRPLLPTPTSPFPFLLHRPYFAF